MAKNVTLAEIADKSQIVDFRKIFYEQKNCSNIGTDEYSKSAKRRNSSIWFGKKRGTTDFQTKKISDLISKKTSLLESGKILRNGIGRGRSGTDFKNFEIKEEYFSFFFLNRKKQNNK